jgi:hypothetical protein
MSEDKNIFLDENYDLLARAVLPQALQKEEKNVAATVQKLREIRKTEMELTREGSNQYNVIENALRGVGARDIDWDADFFRGILKEVDFLADDEKSINTDAKDNLNALKKAVKTAEDRVRLKADSHENTILKEVRKGVFPGENITFTSDENEKGFEASFVQWNKDTGQVGGDTSRVFVFPLFLTFNNFAVEFASGSMLRGMRNKISELLRDGSGQPVFSGGVVNTGGNHWVYLGLKFEQKAGILTNMTYYTIDPFDEKGKNDKAVQLLSSNLKFFQNIATNQRITATIDTKSCNNPFPAQKGSINCGLFAGVITIDKATKSNSQLLKNEELFDRTKTFLEAGKTAEARDSFVRLLAGDDIYKKLKNKPQRLRAGLMADEQNIRTLLSLKSTTFILKVGGEKHEQSENLPSIWANLLKSDKAEPWTLEVIFKTKSPSSAAPIPGGAAAPAAASAEVSKTLCIEPGIDQCFSTNIHNETALLVKALQVFKTLKVSEIELLNLTKEKQKEAFRIWKHLGGAKNVLKVEGKPLTFSADQLKSDTAFDHLVRSLVGEPQELEVASDIKQDQTLGVKLT